MKLEKNDGLETAPDCTGNPFLPFLEAKKIGGESGLEW